jgi:hypothetical protein
MAVSLDRWRAKQAQVRVVSHASRLIAALKENEECQSIELEKELGETVVVGQEALDRRRGSGRRGRRGCTNSAWSAGRRRRPVGSSTQRCSRFAFSPWASERRRVADPRRTSSRLASVFVHAAAVAPMTAHQVRKRIALIAHRPRSAPCLRSSV